MILGMVARWKPVHLGHAAVLRALVRRADFVRIGLGSSNILDSRSPFTAAESAEMIRRVLGPSKNYALIEVPDLFDGPRWRKMVVERFAPLDYFITANRYVRDLLKEDWQVIHPVHLLEEHERIAMDGTQVRKAMALGQDWKAMVPEEVALYLEEEKIVERVVTMFGAEMREEGPRTRASAI